ncbi:MAG: dTMP kinase [Ktedonobacterales bacterium]
MFITFEGGEGAGKTTQAVRLAEHLQSSHYAAQLTREPGGTPLAGAFRALLLHPDSSVRALANAGLASGEELAEPLLPITELLLFSAARAQHVVRIRTWLANGNIVVCDRYTDATRAYQGGGRGLDMDAINNLEHYATEGLKPTVTILLDMPIEAALHRKQHVVKQDLTQLSLFETPAWNRLDDETVEFHKRVRAAYREMAAAEPERWVILDATQAPDRLAERVWQVIEPRPPLR